MLLNKLSKVKTITDPVHELILIEDAVIADLLSTREVQRLANIKQLGGVYLVYPGATHTRLCHSLGTYALMARICALPDVVRAATPEELIYLKIAALLHDLGHGPFSHAFEALSNYSHEKYTINIINGPSEVHDVLVKYAPDLPAQIAKIISKKHPRPFLNQLISSQLDADRMDYLMRDAYFSGLPFGIFDQERILQAIRIRDDKLVYAESALAAIENFFLGRYHMYQQLYLHPNSLGFEVLLAKWFKRLKDLYRSGVNFKGNYQALQALLDEKVMTPQQHFFLHDMRLIALIETSLGEEDAILGQLAHFILNRKRLSYRLSDRPVPYGEGYFDDQVQVGRVLYKRQATYQELVMVLHQEESVELSAISPLVKAIIDKRQHQSYLTFFLNNNTESNINSPADRH